MTAVCAPRDGSFNAETGVNITIECSPVLIYTASRIHRIPHNVHTIEVVVSSFSSVCLIMRALFPLQALAASLLSLTNASTLTPPVLPLVVRNPYLSTWLADAREVPWSKWPMFYTGQSVSVRILLNASGIRAQAVIDWPLSSRSCPKYKDIHRLPATW